ncbi:isochorismatase family protein [Aurantimonas sp. Leaf443]|uniref:isochorismatase family protein n=1 Tax=Aurantimonas sp. Leaf443 TaxID=1736378 RepID=UPI00138F47C4|nr:isochorismatase family protein [Aurantimonas sp. Leaf443]
MLTALPVLTTTARAEAKDALPEGGARLDPRQVQFLFADLQPTVLPLSRTVPPEALGRSAAALAKVATILEIPMLFSVVPQGEVPSTVIDELRPYATAANTVRRTLAGPFMDPPTAAAVAASGRRTMVVAGVATEVAVLHAVLDAVAAGYSVHYVVDAIGGLSERTEAAAMRHMEHVGAVPTSVLSLTTRLTPDFFSPPGSETFEAVKPLL